MPVGQNGGRGRVISWRASLWLVIIGLLAMVLLQAGWRTPPNSLEMSLDRLTADHRFDLTTWEIDAVSGKVADLVRNPVGGLSTEQARSDVREYLDLSNRAGELADEIERAYSDPTIGEPEDATRSQRAELAEIRNHLAEEARTVEAILERQLSEQIEAAGSRPPVWFGRRPAFASPNHPKCWYYPRAIESSVCARLI